MRDIRFRAWDGAKMHYQNFMALALDGERVQHTDDGDWWTHWCDQRFGELEDVIVMQFTGLLDKNGKEIWEGDIVEGGWWIAWNDVSAFWEYRKNPSGAMCPLSENLCVIGNIYENPELLERAA